MQKVSHYKIKEIGGSNSNRGSGIEQAQAKYYLLFKLNICFDF